MSGRNLQGTSVLACQLVPEAMITSMTNRANPEGCHRLVLQRALRRFICPVVFAASIAVGFACQDKKTSSAPPAPSRIDSKQSIEARPGEPESRDYNEPSPGSQPAEPESRDYNEPSPGSQPAVELPFHSPLVTFDYLNKFWSERRAKAGTPVVGGTRPVFVDVRETSGIEYRNSSRGFNALRLPEVKSGSVVIFDYDSDGMDDLYFPDFSPKQVFGEGESSKARLYRNLGKFQFEDVTREAGLGVDEATYGGTSGDFDKDGDTDLILTAFDKILVFENNGRGSFTDVSKESGIQGNSFFTTAEVLDYDLDGNLDVVVLSAYQWTPELVESCKKRWAQAWSELDQEPGFYEAMGPIYPLVKYRDEVSSGMVVPACLPGTRTKLFHGLGGGRFEDVSMESNIGIKETRGLGLAVMDINMDLYPDLLVANDMSPEHLYLNEKDGTFKEIAVSAGVAYGEEGNSRAGMGIAVSYLHGDDELCFALGYYSGEPVPLYCQSTINGQPSPLRFQDRSGEMGPGEETIPMVTFGMHFLDYDSDSWPDLFMANGHLSRLYTPPGTPVLQTSSVYQNFSGRKLDEWILPATEALGTSVMGRAMAKSDLDNDGDVDLVIACNGNHPLLLRNDTEHKNNSLIIKLKGTASNPEGLGTHVYVECHGKQHQYASLDSNFMSQSSSLLHFGLGQCSGDATIELLWPSGQKSRIPGIKVNAAYLLTEGEDIPVPIYTW